MLINFFFIARLRIVFNEDTVYGYKKSFLKGLSFINLIFYLGVLIVYIGEILFFILDDGKHSKIEKETDCEVYSSNLNERENWIWVLEMVYIQFGEISMVAIIVWLFIAKLFEVPFFVFFTFLQKKTTVRCPPPPLLLPFSIRSIRPPAPIGLNIIKA